MAYALRYARELALSLLMPEGFALLLHAATAVLVQYFFMSTIDRRLISIAIRSGHGGDHEELEELVHRQSTFFAIALPVIGTAGSMLFGVFRDLVLRGSSALSFTFLFVLCLAWQTMALVPSSPLQYATLTIYIVWRICWFVNLSQHVFSNYGRSIAVMSVYTSMIALAGLTSFSAPLWNALAELRFGGSFFETDLILGVLNLATQFVATVAVVCTRTKWLRSRLPLGKYLAPSFSDGGDMHEKSSTTITTDAH